MKPEDWRRLDSILDQAAELPSSERDAWLRKTCGDDSELLALALAGARDGKIDSRFLNPPSLGGIIGPGEESLLAGRSLGEFELKERIGAGGMGVVYRAAQTPLDREVAVKVLLWSTFDDPSRRERFVREARTIARLDHPGIVRIYSAAEMLGIGYIAMELLTGPDLAAEIERLSRRDGTAGPLVEFEAQEYIRVVVRLVANAAEALACAHEHGIVHRDVKPANILFDGAGALKLVDFGLASDKESSALSKTGQFLGTFPYMSPEQIQGKSADLDARTDVYSLGVVLFELLTLRRPFVGDLSKLLPAITRGEVPPPSSLNRRVPRDLDLICRTAMERDAARRYQSAGALRDDLERFLHNEAISIEPPTISRRVLAFARRRRAVLGVAAGLAIALALGAGGAKVRANIVEREALPDVELRLSASAFELYMKSPASVHGARVHRRAVDPLSGALGPPLELGRMGQAVFVDQNVPVGNWRYIVSLGNGVSGEFTRYLAQPSVRGERTSIVVHLGSASDLRQGMVYVDAQRYRFDNPPHFGCTTYETECDVEAFWIDEREVSNADYIRFLEATGHALPRRWLSLGCKTNWRELNLGHDAERWLSLPIAGMSWLDARDYAEWAGKRLPTHVELEYVLRGPRAAKALAEFDPLPGIAGSARTDIVPAASPAFPGEFFAEYLAGVVPVDDPSFRQPPLGLYHAFGNVAEHTESFFADGRAPHVTIQISKRLYLGGSWDSKYFQQGLDTHAGSGIDDTYIKDFVGFRCALSANR